MTIAKASKRDFPKRSCGSCRPLHKFSHQLAPLQTLAIRVRLVRWCLGSLPKRLQLHLKVFTVIIATWLIPAACGDAGESLSTATTAEVVPYKLTAIELQEVNAVEAKRVEAYRHLRVGLEQVPRQVSIDNTLGYLVSLTNTSTSAIDLQPCPGYLASFGESSIAISQTSFLNCDDAPRSIRPSESLRFEMQIPVRGNGIKVGFVGSLYWRLLSAPSEGSGRAASAAEITVTESGSATTKVNDASKPINWKRVFDTTGLLLGQGPIQWGSEPGRWGVFLEGSSQHPEVRHVVALESGRVVCNSAGSASMVESSPGPTVNTCREPPIAVTFGVVPGDVSGLDVTLVGAGGRRVVTDDLALSAADVRVRTYSVVYSTDEVFSSMSGQRVDGSVFNR